jgi:hypothetical protein
MRWDMDREEGGDGKEKKDICERRRTEMRGEV